MCRFVNKTSCLIPQICLYLYLCCTFFYFRLFSCTMSSLGKPAKLQDDILPTELHIYHHFLHLMKVKFSTGEWRKNTELSVKLRCVRDDVAALWDLTGIAHGLTGKEGERKICTLLAKCRNTFKVPMARRQEGFAQEHQVLFDVALCQHTNDQICTCDWQNKVQIFRTFTPLLNVV